MSLWLCSVVISRYFTSVNQALQRFKVGQNCVPYIYCNSAALHPPVKMASKTVGKSVVNYRMRTLRWVKMPPKVPRIFFWETDCVCNFSICTQISPRIRTPNVIGESDSRFANRIVCSNSGDKNQSDLTTYAYGTQDIMH